MLHQSMIKRTFLFFLIIFTFAFTLFLLNKNLTHSVKADTDSTSIIVCPRGNNDNPDCNKYIGGDGIQRAVNDSLNSKKPNLMITIKQGSYTLPSLDNGNGINIERDIDKTITLKGSKGVILNGSKINHNCIKIAGKGLTVNLKSLTIKDCKEDGVLIQNHAKANLSDVKITGTNANQGGGAIEITSPDGDADPTTVTISNSTISNNKGAGIYLQGSPEATISNSTISNNKHEGIYLRDSSKATVSNNVINNNEHNGIHLQDLSTAIITNNTIVGNKEVGIGVFEGADADVNITAKNNIIANTKKGDNKDFFGYAVGGDNLHNKNKTKNDIFTYNLIFNNAAGDKKSEPNNLSLADLNKLNDKSHGNVYKDPLFTKDYHLRPNSPACTGGENGAYIGAFPCGALPSVNCPKGWIQGSWCVGDAQIRQSGIVNCSTCASATDGHCNGNSACKLRKEGTDGCSQPKKGDKDQNPIYKLITCADPNPKNPKNGLKEDKGAPEKVKDMEVAFDGRVATFSWQWGGDKKNCQGGLCHDFEGPVGRCIKKDGKNVPEGKYSGEYKICREPYHILIKDTYFNPDKIVKEEDSWDNSTSVDCAEHKGHRILVGVKARDARGNISYYQNKIYNCPTTVSKPSPTGHPYELLITSITPALAQGQKCSYSVHWTVPDKSKAKLAFVANGHERVWCDFGKCTHWGSNPRTSTPLNSKTVYKLYYDGSKDPVLVSDYLCQLQGVSQTPVQGTLDNYNKFKAALNSVNTTGLCPQDNDACKDGDLNKDGKVNFTDFISWLGIKN